MTIAKRGETCDCYQARGTRDVRKSSDYIDVYLASDWLQKYQAQEM